MQTWAYIFINTRQLKKVLGKIRKISSVVHADAILGSPDIIAIVAGSDIINMDSVIDKIAEIPLIISTDSKIARWIDDVVFPFLSKD